MSFGSILNATDISASGLAAERLRMEVAANNIANAYSTRSVEGGAYRRQQVVFAEALGEARRAGGARQRGELVGGLQGVRVVGVESDQSPLPTVFDPGHPDADENGLVQMPNVKLPHEMVDLMTASRAYEANLKSLQTFRQMAEQALSVLQGIG